MMPIPFELAPDEAVIRRFFTEVIDDDIHVAAIKPDGTNIGAYFGSDVEAAVDRAVKYNVSGRNIYWTANRCDEEVGSKPSKEEILSARFSQVDIDPPKNGSPFDKAGAISTLETCSLPPSVIVDSGNGIQALWRFAEDSSDFERVEVINRALIERFAGDSGFNIDKLMRVPGTVNYPNAAKLKRGCVPVMSRLVSYHPERLHTLNELEICFPIAAVSEAKVRAAVVVPDDVELLTSGDLSQGDTAKLRKMLDTPEDYFRNSDRSAWAYGIACQMVDDGYSNAEVLGILLNPDNAGCAHVGDQADAMRAAVRTLTRAKERYLLPPGQSIFGDEAPSPSNRPTIRIVPGELADTIDLAEQALLVADLGYFQSGGRIVRVGVIPGAKLQGGAGRTRLIEVGQAEIGEAFTTAAVWLRTGPKGDIRADCPSVIAETYLARVGKWRLPPLAGVIDVPTLRPDGSLLSVAGYDGATGLLLVPSMQAFPTIPASPTKGDAVAALDLLLQPLADFPFVTEADRSVALSALLTSVCRPALGSAPLHGLSATTAGSGKSKLVDLASILRTGREAAPIAQGKTAEELEKRLGALLLEGEGVIAIDNCETPLGGEFLCQLMTQTSLKVRPLGKSVMVEVPTSTMVTATGNNLRFVGDMGRRTLLCQLDPGVERPELREFAFDPVQVMKDGRGEFVAAVLTILRSYHVAGKPFQVPPLGSFVEWSNWVRSALIWLGCADPCLTMDKVRKADPILASIKAVMAQWASVLEEGRVTTSLVIDTADELEEAAPVNGPRRYEHAVFRDALLAVAGDGGRINGRRLGNWLAQHRDRVVGGRKFVSPATRGGQLLWVLETVAG